MILFVWFSQAAGATCYSFCNAYMDTELQLSTLMIGIISSAGQFASIFAPMLLPMLAAAAATAGHSWQPPSAAPPA